MPFYLSDSDVMPQVAGLRSVLMVPCRFCPAASLAVRKNKPYLEPLRRLLRTQAYESYIKNLKHDLEGEGIEVSVFDSKLPHQFVACMWTERRRNAFAQRASQFDGVVVLGCNAAVETMRDALGSSDCRVIGGMVEEGIMNVLPVFSRPANLSLMLRGVNRVKTERKAQVCCTADFGV